MNEVEHRRSSNGLAKEIKFVQNRIDTRIS